MKPDGTYTVDEILQICNDQLWSWERQELAEKLGTDFINSIIRNMSADELENVSGYYVYEEEPEFDADEELSTCDLIDMLVNRLSYVSITQKQKKLLKTMAETAETWD